ncbi:hypothetical protein F6I03_00310 [Aerococcus sanguinicola]|uniref:Cell wall-active antibiotics response LiaF-like C-terminal domain-containing protein n=1 Tax=Aerococcus sanguinicola TaxID=119206 RepID=A0A5N1GMZ4_9LACT|nr:LiaF domain-containing protein [Aerococcus sp. UMB9870]KAA9301686.1 hypothetical protein F6I03_00310 [Aerococcus sanguinicola]
MVLKFICQLLAVFIVGLLLYDFSQALGIFLIFFLAISLLALLFQLPAGKTWPAYIRLPLFFLALLILCLTLFQLAHFWLILSLTGLIIGLQLWQKERRDTSDFQLIQGEEGIGQRQGAFFQLDDWFGFKTVPVKTYDWNNFHDYSLHAYRFIDLTEKLPVKGKQWLAVSQLHGRIKLVLPQAQACQLNIQAYRTQLTWQGQTYCLNNQRLTLRTDNDLDDDREVIIDLTQFWGEVEVVFL